MHIVPLGFVFAVGVKDLHAVVFAVRYVDVTVLVRADVVHDVELARICARLAPGKEQLAVRRVFVHPGVTIPVGDIDLVFRRKSHVRAAIGRLSALVGSRLAGNAERQEDFSVKSALANRVIAVVRAVDGVVRTHRDPVGALEETFAPGAEKAPVAIEDDDGMLPPAEQINSVLSVHSYCGDLAIGPSVEQLAPAFHHLVEKLAFAHCRSNRLLPPFVRISLLVTGYWFTRITNNQ